MQQRFSFLATQIHAFQQPIVVLDLEATGGNLITDRITEIAYLRFDAHGIKAVQHLVNPQTHISDFIANLTGINNEMVAHAPTFATLIEHILPDLRGSILIAHNSHFDYTLLSNELSRFNVDFAMSTLCTVKLSKKLYPNEYKHNLDAIAQRLNLTHTGNRHRAMTDVLLLTDFLQHIAQQFPNTWIQAATQLLHPPRPARLLPENLVHDLSQLGQGCGVAHWQDECGNTIAVCDYAHGFVDAMKDLTQHPIQSATQVQWRSAVGELDALIQAIHDETNGLPRLHKPSLKRFTLAFVERKGCLKANIVPLNNQVSHAPPYGIFLHPKAAQKALQTWAKNADICLTMLGFNPHKLPENAPCAALQTHGCCTACREHNVVLHNENVRAALMHFPLGDWTWQQAMTITETHPLTGKQKTFYCERGAVQLNEHRWYCGGDWLDLMKRKAKQRHHEIRPANAFSQLKAALLPVQKMRK